jgi:putative acetyltransferase
MPRSRSPTGPSGSAGRSPRLRVRLARGAEDLRAARRLVGEYVRGLGLDLGFQGIDRELEAFPAAYAPPRGRLLLARVDGRPAGCVGVRPFEGSICEMKRLYVRRGYRRLGLGRRLAIASVRAARRVGYRRMRLDTLGSMTAAIGLYRTLGFREIRPYRFNPEPGARYFELDLTASPPARGPVAVPRRGQRAEPIL